MKNWLYKLAEGESTEKKIDEVSTALNIPTCVSEEENAELIKEFGFGLKQLTCTREKSVENNNAEFLVMIVDDIFYASTHEVTPEKYEKLDNILHGKVSKIVKEELSRYDGNWTSHMGDIPYPLLFHPKTVKLFLDRNYLTKDKLKSWVYSFDDFDDPWEEVVKESGIFKDRQEFEDLRQGK